MALTVSQLRKALAVMDESELRELIEALYKASTDNKRFLASQLEGDNSELLEVYIKELEKCFDPKKGELTFWQEWCSTTPKVALPLARMELVSRMIPTPASASSLHIQPHQGAVSIGSILKEP